MTIAPLPFQLAQHGRALPSGPDWTFQRKYDGYRAQVIRRDGEVRIFSRGGQDWTRRFPEIAAAVSMLPVDCILDGEICAIDRDGRTSYSWLGAPADHHAKIVLVAFDLLSLDGHDLRIKPLSERRQQLEQLRPSASDGQIRVINHVDGNGGALFESTRHEQHEGIIAKRLDALYLGIRNRDWQKFKHRRSETFLAIGWKEDDQGLLTSILVVSPDGSYRGRVGTGFSAGQRSGLPKYLRASNEPCAFAANVPLRLRCHTKWLAKPILASVEFLEFTGGGLLREPSLSLMEHLAHPNSAREYSRRNKSALARRLRNADNPPAPMRIYA